MSKPTPPASTIDELVTSVQLQTILSGDDLRLQIFSTISLFNEALRCDEFISILKWHVGELCTRTRDRSVKDSLWLDILSVGVSKSKSSKSPHMLMLLDAMQRIDVCISTRRVLPTGIALRDSVGRRTHLAHSHLESFYGAAALAEHVILYTCAFAFSEKEDGTEYTAYLRQTDSVLEYLLEKLDSCGAERCCVCVYALHCGIKNGIFLKMVRPMFMGIAQAIVKRLKIFLADVERYDSIKKEYDGINSLVQENFDVYSACLCEVTGHEDEEDLDLPVECYFKDNEILKKTYIIYSDSQKQKDVIRNKYEDYQRYMSFQFLSLRSLFLLMTSVVSFNFNINGLLENSSLEAYRRIDRFNQLKISDVELVRVLIELPWTDLCDLYTLESEVFGDSALLVLCATVLYLSSAVQEILCNLLLPLVSRRLVQNFHSITALENRILCIFQFFVLRGCSQRVKNMYKAWNHEYDTKKPPNWISQILILGSNIVKFSTDDYRAVNRHISFMNGVWEPKGFYPHYQVSNMIKIFLTRASGLIASSTDENFTIDDLSKSPSHSFYFLNMKSRNLIDESLSSNFEMLSSNYRSSFYTSIDSFSELLDSDFFWSFYPIIGVIHLETLFDSFLHVMESDDINMVHKAVIAFSSLISGGIYPSRHPSKYIAPQQSTYTQHAISLLSKNDSKVVKVMSTLCHNWLYSALPIDHFTATSPSGCCLAASLSKLLSWLAYFDVVDVGSILFHSVKHSKFTWNHEIWDKWQVIFFVAIQSGVVGLFDYLRESHLSYLMDDNYPPLFRAENGAFWRCDEEIRYVFLELMAVLAGKDSRFCRFLIDKEAVFALFVDFTLSNTKNIKVRNFMFKLICEMLRYERASNSDHIVALHSKMNQIRMSLFYEKEYLGEIYFVASSSCAFLQSKLGTNPERFVDPYVDEDGISVTKRCDEDPFSFEPPPVALEGTLSKIFKKSASTASRLSRAPIRRQIMEEDVMASSNYTWFHIESYISCKNAIDSLLYSFECLTEVCDGRMEFIEMICSYHPGLFLLLPGCFSKLPGYDNMCTEIPLDEIMNGYHLKLVKVSVSALRTLLKRSSESRKLAINSGCVEALMESITASLEVKDDELRTCIVKAVELLVLRDPAAWDYLKKISGIDGLLTLIRGGNVALQISSCSSLAEAGAFNVPYIDTMLDKGVTDTVLHILRGNSPEAKLSALILVRVVVFTRRGRLEMLQPERMSLLGNLLQKGESPVVIQSVCEVMSVLAADNDAALRLSFQNAEKQNRKGSYIVGRLMEMTQGSVLQLPEVAEKFISKEETPQEEDAALNQSVRAIVLSAAHVLAGATDSEESEWPDGSAPLRNTLQNSGILPSLRG